MKVLHAAETIKGGTATVMQSLINYQRSQNQNIKTYVLVPSNQSAYIETESNEELHVFRSRKRNAVSLIAFCWVFFKLVLKERPNIVHLHSSFAGLCGRLLVKLLRKKRRPVVIYCPHGWAFLVPGATKRNSVFAGIERRLAGLCDAIICVSDFERETATSYGFSKNKLHLIYNGVPVQLINSSEVRRDDSLVTRAAFIGRLDHQKGFDILVSAMSQINHVNLKLQVIGASVRAGADDLLAGLDLSVIEYVGWLSHAELVKRFASIDLLIVPSRWEGFAIAPLEAMSFGVAVISSDCCSMPEMIRDGLDGKLFANGNANELAQKLNTTERKEWIRLGEEGRQRQISFFDSVKMCEKTLELYKKFL